MKGKVILSFVIAGFLFLTSVSAQLIDGENLVCVGGDSLSFELEEGETRYFGQLPVTLIAADENNFGLSARISVFSFIDLFLSNDEPVVFYKQGDKVYEVELISASDNSASLRLTVLLECQTQAPPTEIENSCFDTDGRNFDTYGEVKFRNGFEEGLLRDFCRADRAYDYSCDGSIYDLGYVNCPNGCQNGACVQEPKQIDCKETDGGLNYFKQGVASGTLYDGTSRREVEDVCTVFNNGKQLDVKSCSGDDCKVTEWFCSGNTLQVDYNSDCSNGCFDGACLVSVNEPRFRSASFTCYDGIGSTSGEDTSCKSTDVWREAAEEFCSGRCNADGSKCGVNTFQVHEQCFGDDATPSLVIGEDIGEFDFSNWDGSDECFIKGRREEANCKSQTALYTTDSLGAVAGVFSHSFDFTEDEFVESWTEQLDRESDFEDLTITKDSHYYLITAFDESAGEHDTYLAIFTWFDGRTVVYLVFTQNEPFVDQDDDVVEPVLDAYFEKYPSDLSDDVSDELIVERVQCVFQESSGINRCYSSDERFLCRGYDSCTAKVFTERENFGRRVVWRSSCEGTATTVIDGRSEHVLFYCGDGDDDDKPSEPLYNSATWVCGNGEEITSESSCKPYSAWKETAKSSCKKSCSQPDILLSPLEDANVSSGVIDGCGVLEFEVGDLCGQDSVCLGGCEEGNVCYPIGYRKGGEFCSLGVFTEQFEGGVQCENNFECGSNVCVSGQCIEQSLIDRFVAWFRRFFG